MSEAASEGRLRWKCRRGMRELDVLLTSFLERRYPGLSPHLRSEFAALLELQDPELFALMLGRSEPGPEIAGIVAELRDFSPR